MKSSHNTPRRPVVLVIMDGFGINPSKMHNAVEAARTPNLDAYFSHYPHTLIQASGPPVGLPDGQMGNSEVGHMCLGAGSVIQQDIMRINYAIEDDSFYQNPALLAAIDGPAAHNRPVHLFGLVSDGGVHSQLGHLQALIRLCKQRKAKPLLHMITDGRDTAPKSALSYLPQLESQLHEAGGGIASIMGRFYAMDRDNRWERTEKAWRAYILGKGEQAQSADSAIRSAYAKGDNDEFIQPILLPMFQPLQSDDHAIWFNFRKDRPRQMIDALCLDDFDGFDRGDAARPKMTCMMPYNQNWDLPYAFDSDRPATCLAKVLSEHKLKQFHCAETEKYPHVTYFFNGGHNEPFDGETQVVIPSPKVATYDLKPEMSAAEVADTVVKAIRTDQYSFIVVNFANGDMVGHTAVPEAVIRAVEALDTQVGRVIETAVSCDYSVIVTADHGNCEEMINPTTGAPHTQHTLYPVPCMIIDQSSWELSCTGSLSNIAPTVLQLMGLEIPAEMKSKSLLLKENESTIYMKKMSIVA